MKLEHENPLRRKLMLAKVVEEILPRFRLPCFPGTIGQSFDPVKAGEVAGDEIKFLRGAGEWNEGSDAMNDTLNSQQRQNIAKDFLLIEIETNALVPEMTSNVEKIAGAAAEIEKALRRRPIQRQILRAFDVAFDPELHLGPTIHFASRARIFPAQLRPGRIALQRLKKSRRIDGMKKTRHLLARAGDDLWIDQLLQLSF